MHITFMSSGTIQIDNARLCFRNFRGEASMYNAKGNRNFAIVIPDEATANALMEEGWNVKIKAPREEGGDPFIYMPVKVNFNEFGPRVYLRSGNALRKLDQDTVGMLDHIRIESADMDIRPYNWSRPNGDSGRSAFLQAIRVTQALDRFEDEYQANSSYADDYEEKPF